MRKIIASLLLIATVLPLASCNKEEKEVFYDKDFDGLYDDVDPNSNSNVYKFNYRDDKFPLVTSIDDEVRVDFRNFIFDEKPSYQPNIAKMASLIISTTYSYAEENVKFLSNKYSNVESTNSAIFVQFGFQNVEHLHMPTYTVDKEDLAGVFAGNHLMTYNDKNYQVFAFAIEGYPTPSVWFSNFDIGSKEQIYEDLYGNHPDWKNKNHHKGFDVTANRAYALMRDYIARHTHKGCEQYVFLTGQSRGAAISNLIGKRFFDDGFKSQIYCFNDPSPVFLNGYQNANLDKYTNIFNFNCDQDLLASYPFKMWNVGRYGINFTYDLAAHSEEYSKYFNQDFQYIPTDNFQDILNTVKKMMPTRESLYEFNEIDEDIDEFELFKTELEADDRVEKWKSQVKDARLSELFNAEVLESGDEDKPYKAQFYTRPIVFFFFIADIVESMNFTTNVFVEINNKFEEFSPLMKRYKLYMADLFSKWFPNPFQVILPHIQKSCILGISFLKEA